MSYARNKQLNKQQSIHKMKLQESLIQVQINSIFSIHFLICFHPDCTTSACTKHAYTLHMCACDLTLHQIIPYALLRIPSYVLLCTLMYSPYHIKHI